MREQRADGGGGFIGEICIFLSIVGAALVAVLNLLTPRPDDERGQK